MRTLCTMMLILLSATLPLAGEDLDATATGQVHIPLETYQELVRAATDPARPTPATHALGRAAITVVVSDDGPRPGAIVRVGLTIDVFENAWALIPVLPSGTPVDTVTVDGKPVQLLPTPAGLAWVTEKKGSFRMDLAYRVDATRSGGGFALPLPVPQAAATQLDATLPGTRLDASVIPSAGLQTRTEKGNTRLTATVPTTAGVQIAWRRPDGRDHAISRADYGGRLSGDAIVWTGTLDVELFDEETVELPLFPTSVTLGGVEVDGKPTPILVDQGRFVTRVAGAGSHRITVRFETPVHRGNGPPRADVSVPSIPVSRFELAFPGAVDLSVQPAANVTHRTENGETIAAVHVPLTGHVAFTWSEAVPDELRTELRASAATYHAVHAEEGVLYVRALMSYEISRGETSRIEIEIPPGVQINRIVSPSGAVADWRISQPAKDGARTASVFLDRKLEGPILLDLFYDRSLDGDAGTERVDVPLVRAVDAQRQRGMIALLQSRELTLDPESPTEARKVGEDQLPGFVRDALQMTVAHTYKYGEGLPRLVVRPSVPERIPGRFDVQVDTLVSLADVTVTAAAGVAVNVKSGTIETLQLELPRGVNLLHLGAPSLRDYEVREEAGGPVVFIAFTREMEGQFRVETTYERILADGSDEVGVPLIRVRGDEVEQGRIAVEALSAVEVKPTATDQLTTLDIGELPRQLVLRTTHPILLAYKYVDAGPGPRLALALTRHDLVDVREAVIDTADYRTLFTRDGLAVTTARFQMRNSRSPFLRVELPPDSEVWSVFVDGKPEKPAAGATGDGDDAPSVLIKILNASEGFPVELIYATPVSRIGWLGSVRAALPRPDILATRTRWDLYLPSGVSYGDPDANLDVVQDGTLIAHRELDAEFGALPAAAVISGPPRIDVPTSGIHFAFEKLYANQSEEPVAVRIAYAAVGGEWFGRGLALAGWLLVWIGLGSLLRPEAALARRPALVALAGGTVAVLLAYRLWPGGLFLPLTVSLLVFLALAAIQERRRWTAAGEVTEPS